MKTPAIKVIVAFVLAVGVVAAFVAWFQYSFALKAVFVLMWPSLALARIGIPHSWVLSAVVIIGGATWLGFWSRCRAWSRVIIASLIFPTVYCGLAFWFATRAPVPLPTTTTYDSIPLHRTAYLEAYDSGYRHGVIGSMRTYCFSPEAETRGYYDGTYQGIIVWYRMLGRTMPESTKRWFGSSAARDGVVLELK